MRPQRLLIEGLRSYRDAADIDFSVLGLTAVIGDTGAGKSSIIEALTLALFNRPTWPSQGRNVQALRADGAAAMRVSLTFTVGDRDHAHTWTVTRIHKANSTPAVHKLECADTAEKVDGERNINARIEQLIGLNYEQFTKAVVIPQGQFARLLEQTPANRTETLKGIFRLDHLSIVKDHADEMLRRYAEPVAERRGRRKDLPPDPNAAVLDAECRLKSLAEHAEKLALAVTTIARHELLGNEAEQIARAAAQGAAKVRAQIDEAHVHELHRASAAAEEIAESTRIAKADREVALAAAADARAAALSALAPFATRDDAVAARASLEGGIGTAERLAAGDEKLAALRVELEDEAAADERGALVAEADEARGRAEALATAFGIAQKAAEAAEADASRANKIAQAARKAVAGAEKAVNSARVALEAAVEANALAAATTDCQPGDDCPVCARPLPAGFVPPSDPGIQQARSEHAAGTEALEEARAGAALGEQAAAEAVELLETRRQESQRSLERKTAADKVVASAELAVQSAETSHTAAVLKYDEEVARLASERDQGNAALADLPEPYRATLDDVASATTALAMLSAALQQAEEHEEAAREADGLAAQAWNSERDAITRLDAEVHQPVAAARTAAAMLAVTAAELVVLLGDDDQAMPPSPAATAVPSEVAAWVEGLHLAALAAALAADGLAMERNATAATALATASALLAEHDVADLDGLRSLAAVAGEDVALARRDLANARAAVVTAERLDQFLDVGEPFIANLATLSQTLTNSKFIGSLVNERERELLIDASRKLRDLTGSNFGFAEGFRIVDRRTGQQRAPETLSGGERFLASLALALALVEIATRGGGQLDALFLDEGFGSLDAASLDQALSTLGNLAVGGKLVALVSHLRRVAEYVDDVLLVERDDVLGSRIRPLSPDQRDDLLAEDARSGLTA